MTPDTRRLDWILRALSWFQCGPFAFLVPPSLRYPAVLGLTFYYHTLRFSTDPDINPHVRAPAQRWLGAVDAVTRTDPAVLAAPPLPFPLDTEIPDDDTVH